MKLVFIDQYIKALQVLFEGSSNNSENSTNRHVFLATEDPEVVQAFQEAAPSHWEIYVDPYVLEYWEQRKAIEKRWNGNPRLSSSLEGRPGLVSLASLLIAMEAAFYVLTNASNWSILMDILRRTIIDPMCGNCSRMIDLRPMAPPK